MDDYTEAFGALKPLHEKHREILMYINDFCAELNIDFCLAYGSALGARRHSGPIPWDDDTDVYMTVCDYERFRSAFFERGDRERFYLQENISAEGMTEFAKLRLNNTTFIQPNLKNLDMHQGIYADIFLLHPAPKSAFGRMAGRCAGYYVELKRMAMQNYRDKKAFLPLMWLLRNTPRTWGIKAALKLMYRSGGENSGRLVSWGVPYRIYSEDMFFPTKKLNYEGLMLPVPGKIEDYLEYVYGDWRQPPDIKTAAASAHSSVWKTDEDFRLYAPNIRSFSDEIHIK